MKPFSQACENNKQAIVEQLGQWLVKAQSVLEVGSGTGQHAVYFTQHFPYLQWQCSDVAQNLSGINAWLEDAALANLPSAVELDLNKPVWPGQYDAVFSANTAHIVPWPLFEVLLKGLTHVLNNRGLFILYGPFKYGGQFTSQSNHDFDLWLKDSSPLKGIREFENIDSILQDEGFFLHSDVAMPANNQLLVWQKA